MPLCIYYGGTPPAYVSIRLPISLLLQYFSYLNCPVHARIKSVRHFHFTVNPYYVLSLLASRLMCYCSPTLHCPHNGTRDRFLSLCNSLMYNSLVLVLPHICRVHSLIKRGLFFSAEYINKRGTYTKHFLDFLVSLSPLMPPLYYPNATATYIIFSIHNFNLNSSSFSHDLATSRSLKVNNSTSMLHYQSFSRIYVSFSAYGVATIPLSFVFLFILLYENKTN